MGVTRDCGQGGRSTRRGDHVSHLCVANAVHDAINLARYETAVRPENLRWNDWTAGQLDKVACGLDALEKRSAGIGDRVDLGTIAFGCALGYLDFRFASLGWRSGRPNTSASWPAKGGRTFPRPRSAGVFEPTPGRPAAIRPGRRPR